MDKINFKRYSRGAVTIGLAAVSFIAIAFHLALHMLVTIPEATTSSIWLLSRITYGLYGIAVLLCSWFVSKEINIRYLYQLGGLYGLYLLGSYFLTITRNLNNGAFRVLDLQANGFFQTKFLPTMVLILVLAFAIQFVTNRVREKGGKNAEQADASGLTLHGLMALVILTDSLSNEVIVRLYSPLLSVGFANLALRLLIYTASLFVIYFLLSYFTLQGAKALMQNTPNLALVVSSSFLFGLVFNYLLQFGVKKDDALMDMFIFPAATAYQIILIFILSLLVYLLINRYLLSTVLIVSFWSTISVVNSIKMAMRNEPMLLTDFSWLKQINLVLEFINLSTVLWIVLGLGIVFAIYFLLRKRILPGRILSSLKIRLASIAAIFALLSGIFMVFHGEKHRIIMDGVPVLSQLNNNYNTFWLDLSYHARYRSLLFVWTKQLTASAVEKPAGYSKKRMEELAEKYKNEAEKINQDRTEDISDQTVIFILSESYANPNRLEGITVSQDIMPNIRNIMSANTSGTMKSDGYGGGTANMEWQSLVGLPMYNMSESISTINTEVVPNMPVVPAISDLFEKKNRHAIHLGDAATYARNTLYADKLHFADFLANKNGTINTDDFYRLGLFPSDESTYNAILRSIDESKSQFFSTITYQNHIPYSYGEPADLTASGQFLSADENDSLTSYVRLMYYTDIETQKFLDSLSALKKKVTVVFYGDHLPGIYPAEQFESAPQTQYETDYFIWSNYQTVKRDYPYVNSSDFPAALLAHTNSKVSPYYALLTKVLEEASVGHNNLTEEQRAIADDLILVEYDLISGKGYLNNMESFFKVAE